MYRIGIDLGGTFIKGGIIKNDSEIVYNCKVPTPKGHEVDKVCEAISDLITELKKHESVRSLCLEGIGIGSPGVVDSTNGIVRYSNNFAWNEPAYLVDEISKTHKEPVFIGNDAKCAALGEWVFNGCDTSKTSILLTLGTGVGSGLIVNGKIYGADNAGSVEMGHMVIKENGRKCTCGNRGCLEAYGSVTGLIKDGEKSAKANKKSMLYKCMKKNNGLNGLLITDAVRNGDMTAIHVFDKYTKHICTGLISIVNIFRPDVIFIGGGLSESFDLMEAEINKELSRKCFGGDKAMLPVVVKAKCGNDAGIIGAAYLAKS